MTPESQPREVGNRRATLLKVLCAFMFTVALIVVPVLTPSTHGAFTASIKNLENRAEVIPYFTCAEAMTKTSGAVFAFHLASSPAANLVNKTSTGTADSKVKIVPSIGGCTNDSRGFMQFPGEVSGSKPEFLYTIPGTPTSSFTQEIWFRTKVADGAGLMYADDPSSTIRNNRQVYVTDLGKFAMGSSKGLVAEQIHSTQSVNDGNWHHGVAVRSVAENRISLYVDGEQAANGQIRFPDLDNFQRDAWKIGCGRLANRVMFPDAKRDCIEADIAFVAVYDHVLTEQQIKNHYRAGTWKRP